MESENSTSEEVLALLSGRLADSSTASPQDLEIIPNKLALFEEQGLTNVCQQVLEMLGTAVGSPRIWRDVFRTAGILEYSLEKLKPGGATINLAKQHLRIVGNSVADNNENRSIALNSLENLIGYLAVDELMPTALGAIFNLCNDYEPGARQAANLRLDHTLVPLIAKSKIPDDSMDSAGSLIVLTVESLSSSELVGDTSLEDFTLLLDAITPFDFDVEKHHSILEICGSYLSNKDFVPKVPVSEVERLFNILLAYERQLDDPAIHILYQILAQPLGQHSSEIQQDDDSAYGLVMQSHFINAIGAVSATKPFAEEYNFQSTLIKTFTSNLLALSSDPSKVNFLAPSAVCWCIVLGNLAISDEICIDLVQNVKLHRPLISILTAREEPALLYAAAGLTRHLAFPKSNRGLLGDEGLINACCHLLDNQSAAVRGEAAAILCKLVDDTPKNITRIVDEHVQENNPTPDPSAMQIDTPDNKPHQTILEYMVNQSLAPSGLLPSASMKSAIVEIGRAIVAIQRRLVESTVHVGLLRRMYKTPFLAEPLKRLARQQIFPEAKSEAIYGLGLMMSSEEGAVCFLANEHDNLGFVKVLGDLFADKDANVGEGLKYDRENALVILTGLQKYAPHLMNGPDAPQLHHLLFRNLST